MTNTSLRTLYHPKRISADSRRRSGPGTVRSGLPESERTSATSTRVWHTMQSVPSSASKHAPHTFVCPHGLRCTVTAPSVHTAHTLPPHHPSTDFVMASHSVGGSQRVVQLSCVFAFGSMVWCVWGRRTFVGAFNSGWPSTFVGPPRPVSATPRFVQHTSPTFHVPPTPRACGNS